MIADNWEKFLDRASEHKQNKKEQGEEKENTDLLYIISKTAVRHDLQPSTRLAIIQLIVKDGIKGGKISINTVKRLIGSPSSQTAISVLKTLEEREIIVRVRSQLGSEYTLTPKFLKSVSKTDAVV